jgi:hypothetical protein
MHAVAAIAIGLATASIMVMDWVPGPLNRNIAFSAARERLPGSLIHVTIGVVLAPACWIGFEPTLVVAAIWYGIVLTLAVRNWWVPYFLDRYPGEITPEVYATQYRRNLVVLPAFRGYPVIPDVQHMVIHALIASASILSLVAAVI